MIKRQKLLNTFSSEGSSLETTCFDGFYKIVQFQILGDMILIKL